MQLLAGTLGAKGGPKLQLSDAVAPVLKPLAVTLASCTTVLEGASACHSGHITPVPDGYVDWLCFCMITTTETNPSPLQGQQVRLCWDRAPQS